MRAQDRFALSIGNSQGVKHHDIVSARLRIASVWTYTAIDGQRRFFVQTEYARYTILVGSRAESALPLRLDCPGDQHRAGAAARAMTAIRDPKNRIRPSR